MNPDWLQNNYIKILLTSSLVAALGGSFLGYLFNKALQKTIWKKDFDRFEAEQVVSIFEQIILKVESREKIDEEIINRLSARIILARYIDQKTKSDLNKLKENCFKHRESLEKSKKSTTGLSQEEDHIKKEIVKNIEEIMDKIRDLFSKEKQTRTND
ncbi:MAG: hypothetical protein WC437_00240 [Patescibacteria group bacterium]